MPEKILVVGSLNMDMVLSVASLPKTGETVLSQSLNNVPGGKGANQAVAMARLGGCVTMLGLTGKDDYGHYLLQNLKSAGVKDRIRQLENVSTGLAVICVDQRGNNSIVVLPGANGAADASFIQEHEDLIASHDIIVTQMEIPLAAVFETIRLAGKHGKKILLNPAPAPEKINEELLKMVDYILPNETELVKLTGFEQACDYEEGARLLIEKGVQHVLVTLGEKGALWINREKTAMFEAPKVKAVDTTAAGDTFIGAFAVFLSEGFPVNECIQLANKAAAISVTREGAQTSIPHRIELFRDLE